MTLTAYRIAGIIVHTLTITVPACCGEGFSIFPAGQG